MILTYLYCIDTIQIEVKTLKTDGFVHTESNLFTKTDILESFAPRKIAEAIGEKINLENRLSTGKETLKMHEDFYNEVKNHSLPDLTNGWYYKCICSDYSIELRMCTKDGFSYETKNEEYTLLKKECKYLTVEEFSNLRGISGVTVRQWIRRGKLRYAKKIGGEWFIPETAENPSRGYCDVEYELLDNTIKIGGFPI